MEYCGLQYEVLTHTIRSDLYAIRLEPIQSDFFVLSKNNFNLFSQTLPNQTLRFVVEAKGGTNHQFHQKRTHRFGEEVRI